MKRWFGLALVSGCYVGAHGSLGTPIQKGPEATTSAEGAVDLGAVATDDYQSGELLVSFGLSPLTARDPAASEAPRMPVVLWGGRYERAFTVQHPELRWFARLLWGGSMCALDASSSTMMTKPDASCMGAGKARDIGEFQTALGIALTSTMSGDPDSLEPSVATFGLALVYSYATDATLGVGDFVGLELSLGIGGDVITPLASKHSR